LHLSFSIKSLSIVYLSGAIKSSAPYSEKSSPPYSERIFSKDIVKAGEYDYPFGEREVESRDGTLKRGHARSAAPFSITD
jgi:hypothetical protein